MLDPNNRIYINHANQLFNPDILSSIYQHMVVLSPQESTDNITEREKHAVTRGESTDAMRMQAAWYNVWKNPISRELLLDAIHPFTYVIYPVQVRHVRKAYQHDVPWHQDIAYIRLLGKRSHQQVLTCFIPLEPDPAKCTTLQFADDNKTEPTKLYKHMPLSGFGAGIKDTQFNEVFHYNLKLGDALIFGDHALHRTFLPEGCQVERRSLEFRLIKPVDAIPNKDYFDVNTLNFIRFDDEMKLITPSI